jgi:hypothetical protein
LGLSQRTARERTFVAAFDETFVGLAHSFDKGHDKGLDKDLDFDFHNSL